MFLKAAFRPGASDGTCFRWIQGLVVLGALMRLSWQFQKGRSSLANAQCASPVHYSAYLAPDAQKIDQGVPCYPKMLETSSGADWPSADFLSEWVWALGIPRLCIQIHTVNHSISVRSAVGLTCSC